MYAPEAVRMDVYALLLHAAVVGPSMHSRCLVAWLHASLYASALAMACESPEYLPAAIVYVNGVPSGQYATHDWAVFR
jgi:hypothetical protein